LIKKKKKSELYLFLLSLLHWVARIAQVSNALGLLVLGLALIEPSKAFQPSNCLDFFTGESVSAVEPSGSPSRTRTTTHGRPTNDQQKKRLRVKPINQQKKNKDIQYVVYWKAKNESVPSRGSFAGAPRSEFLPRPCACRFLQLQRHLELLFFLERRDLHPNDLCEWSMHHHQL
jgi:hypothetical protein